MNKLRGWFTISQLVTGGPIVLLLLLSMVLGGSRYVAEYQSEIKHALAEARIGAQPILNLMNVSVGGGNYANVQDETALELFRASTQLEFFSVQGATNKNKEPYGLVYDAHLNRVMRTAYEEGYVSQLVDKIERSKAALEKLPAEHRKRPVIERMLAEQEHAYEAYQRDLGEYQTLQQEYLKPTPEMIQEGYYLDEHNWKLHLLMPTENSGGGELWMVLDASRLDELGMVILKSVLPVNLITLVVCILLSFMISRVITSPIKEMVVTIRSIEQHSDLTQRMDDSGKDEISQVGRTINAMLEKFQHILKDVNGATLSVAEAAQTMSRTISETAEGIEQQKREAHQLASSANELLAAVNDVANNAMRAAQSAQDANQHAGKGKVEVDITIESINGLAHEVESAVGVMDKLNGEAEQIGAVVDVIKSIAEQTNLLALNAAIEAARAGEQGRGFAVVADEVRTLAKRTQESTSEIEGMIRHLQQGAGDAVQTMKAGEERSLACVEQAGHAGEALELITLVVEQIASMNSQIASAAEQQTEATDNINCFITNIGNIADQNADKAVNCSSLSGQLAKLADSLQINVSKFKV